MKKLFLILWVFFGVTVAGVAQVEVLLDEPFATSLECIFCVMKIR